MHRKCIIYRAKKSKFITENLENVQLLLLYVIKSTIFQVQSVHYAKDNHYQKLLKLPQKSKYLNSDGSDWKLERKPRKQIQTDHLKIWRTFRGIWTSNRSLPRDDDYAAIARSRDLRFQTLAKFRIDASSSSRVVCTAVKIRHVGRSN